RVRMPADERQCVGMDGLGFRAVCRLRRGSIRRLFAAVVQYAQGVARRKFCHQCTDRASELPQLLHARAQRRHRRISYLRAVNERAPPYLVAGIGKPRYRAVPLGSKWVVKTRAVLAELFSSPIRVPAGADEASPAL